MIISASRRTDIPAFYGDWFINRLRAGEVLVRNPMNFKQVTYIPLSPENVDCIVFWTKDPQEFLKYLPEIDSMGYNYYFLFTLNSYDTSLEVNVSKKNKIIDTFKKLSDTIGADRVVWRYDPIIINETYTKDYHFKWYDFISKELSSYTDRCIISFVDLYKKIEKKMNEINSIPAQGSLVKEFAEKFGGIASERSYKLYTCSHDFDLMDFGIEHSKCIDDDIINNIIGQSLNATKDPAQREECGCIESRDVGAYNTCPHRCVYCYANVSDSLVISNKNKFDPSSPLLCDGLRGDENITKYRKSKSLLPPLEQQRNLF